MGDRDDGSGKSSQSRQRSASKVVTESSAFGLESRHRVVAGLCRDLLELLTSLNCQSSPCARNLPPGEIANSAKWWLEDNLYDNSLTDHLGRDRRQIPLHTHENVHTDTCTTCSKPSTG